MIRRVRVLLGALAGLALAALTVLVLGLRLKLPWVRSLVRRLARDVANPRELQRAGTAGSPNSVVTHVGRRSGRTYRTPVTAVRTDDAFVVALPYGPGADWVRNVLAAGAAELLTDGRQVSLHRPEVRPMRELTRVFPPGARLGLRLMGVSECLVLHDGGQDSSGEPVSG